MLLSSIRERCIIRMEQYWSYEICFNKKLRQYHEDQVADASGKKARKISEHLLGEAGPSQKQPIAAQREPPAGRTAAENERPPQFLHKGTMVPYYSEEFGSGDICDLTGRPRRTEVRYVCDPDALHVFESISETSTCMYLAVVHTNVLCAHPLYSSVQSNAVNSVTCIPEEANADVKKSPQPKSLQQITALRKLMPALLAG